MDTYMKQIFDQAASKGQQREAKWDGEGNARFIGDISQRLISRHNPELSEASQLMSLL
jgi:hypothetical protein